MEADKRGREQYDCQSHTGLGSAPLGGAFCRRSCYGVFGNGTTSERLCFRSSYPGNTTCEPSEPKLQSTCSTPHKQPRFRDDGGKPLGSN